MSEGQPPQVRTPLGDRVFFCKQLFHYLDNEKRKGGREGRIVDRRRNGDDFMQFLSLPECK